MKGSKNFIFYVRTGWVFLFLSASLICRSSDHPDEILRLEKELEAAPPDQKSTVLNSISSAYLVINPEKSLRYADSAHEQAILNSNKGEELRALYNLGRASSRMLLYDDALKSFLKALEIAKIEGNDTVISNLLFSLGDVCYLMNNYTDASSYMLSSCQIEEQLNRQLPLAQRYSYLGKIYHASSEFATSILYYDKALVILEKHNERQSLADLYNNFGIVYFDLGIFDKTLELYQKSLTIVEELDDREGIAKTLNNIGIVYYDWGNREKALEYYQKSLKIEEFLNNRQGIGSSYNNIGIIYSDWNQNDLAIDYYQRALEIYESFKNNQGIAMVLNNIGESYHALGDDRKALEYLMQSLEIEKTLANQRGIAESYHIIGSVYLKSGDLAKAEDYNKKSFEISSSLGLGSILMLNYDLFYQIYFQRKEFEKALNNFKNFTLQKDSIYNKQFHDNLTNLQRRYEVDRLEKERVLEIDKSNARSSEVKTQRTFLVIIFILVVIFGVLIYYDIKSKIRANKKLKIINETLTSQKEELTTTLEELNRNEAKYHNLLEFSPTGITYLNKKGNILEINKKMIEIIGSPGEVQLEQINCFEYEPFREMGLSDALLKSIETQELIFNETSYTLKSGKKVDFRYYITPIINRKSNVSGLIINLEDVTLSKEFDRSIKKSELKYRILVENSLQAMLVVRGTKMIFANSRMEELSQYPFHELSDSEDWLRMIIHPDDYEQVKANIRDALDKKKIPARNEYRYIRKDGSVRWMESLGSIVDYDDQPAILVVAIDITERKEAETILLESESQLRKANAMKDKFFSIIAHDLKNPFNAILGFSNLLYEAYDNFSDQQRKTFIKNICDASDSTFKLLQNLLEWSRTQTGKIDFNPEIISVEAIVQENLAVLKSAADRKKIDLVTNIPEQTTAFADGNMTKAIVRNLISNAIKFTKSGGKITITVVNSGDKITTSVADDGVGIKPDDQKRLFRIDDHFRTAGTDHEEGSGLGLILCKEFVEKNGGEIWVESKPGKGSKFIFTLPAETKK